MATAIEAHVAAVAPVAITLPWERPVDGDPVTVPLLFTTPRRGAINRATFNSKAWVPART